MKNLPGCSASEIAEIERSLGVRLPAMYRTWLLLYGHEPPERLAGAHCAYPALLELKREAGYLLQLNAAPFVLTPAHVVFFMRDSCQFLFFVVDGGNDDPVPYEYLDGWPAPRKAAERLSDWLFAD